MKPIYLKKVVRCASLASALFAGSLALSQKVIIVFYHGNFGFIIKVHMLGDIITSLAKEVMFLVALVSLCVCLFVCLSVDNITQKVMNGLG